MLCPGHRWRSLLALALLLFAGGSLSLTMPPVEAHSTAPAVRHAPAHPALRHSLIGAVSGRTGGGPVTPTPIPPCGPAWRLVPSPNTPSGDNYLYDLTALTANDIWAVGEALDQQQLSRRLALHWNGAIWSIVPLPVPDYGMLLGIDSLAADDIWAVGKDGATGFPLTMHWNGSQWADVSTPITQSGELNEVYALAPNDVWAVGVYPNNGAWSTLILHWNSSAWSVVPSPNPLGTSFVALTGVSGSAANDLWAVGYSVDPVLNLRPVIEHWDGAAWTLVPGPAIAGNHTFEKVVALAPNDAWAVGDAGTAPLTAHWDGSAWSNIPNPSSAGTLMAVAARAANDIWAVGTMTQHWDGAQWSIVPNPDPSVGGGLLRSVAFLASNDVWAVGLHAPSGGTYTLIERYHDPCITPTPTVPAPPGSTPTRTPVATGTPPGSPTPAPLLSPTATPCALAFTDVDANNPFYPFIRCLACRQIVAGYSDGTFRWGNDVTRGQLSKIIAGAAGLGNAIPSSQQTFSDVPNGNAFWLWIERLAANSVISGYACGGSGEPCDPQNRPYFRWGAPATRGQIAKIVALAANLADPIPPAQQTFADVPPTNAFWLFIERLAGRQIISGYQCGGPGEPCGPQNRPYFRWGANATRGQMSKIAAQTFYPNCQTPARH